MRNPFSKDKTEPDNEDRRRKDTYIHQGLTPARRKDEGERRYEETRERTRREADRRRHEDRNSSGKSKYGKGR